MKKSNRIVFFNFLSIVLLQGLSIITAPLFSRMLGTDGYGGVEIYNIWMAAVTIVFSFQTLGTMPAARIEYPREKQDAYQSSALFLSTVSFACLSVPVLLLRRPIAGALQLDEILIPLLLVQAFTGYCINYLSSKFVYDFKAGWNCFLSVATAVLTMVLSIGLILWMPAEKGYLGRIFALVLTNVLVGIPALIYIFSSGKTFYHREYWKFCLPLALPFIFYNLSDLLLGQSDRVMLQQMMSRAAVGEYSLALKFGGIMFTIFGALNSTWCPFFFDYMKDGNRESMLRQSKNFLELFTVLSAGFLLLNREVFHVFASRDFWGGTVLIPAFVTGYYLNFLCTFPINYEYFRKQTRMVALVTIVSALINIGLNYVLIQRLDAMGAALATMTSHLLQFTMHYVYARFVLGKGDFPFGARVLGRYVLAYCAVLELTCLTPDFWLLRWGLGAAIGLWELRRIWKRKVLM